MSGAVNGIIGDSMGVDLPQAQPDPEQLKDELAMASFSRSAEFQRLKDHLDSRIAFYQTCLPSGQPVSDKMPTPAEWQAATVIITELRAIIGAYELAAETVKNRGK